MNRADQEFRVFLIDALEDDIFVERMRDIYCIGILGLHQYILLARDDKDDVYFCNSFRISDRHIFPGHPWRCSFF